MLAHTRSRDAMATSWEVSEHETAITFDLTPPSHPASTPRPRCRTACCGKRVSGLVPGVEEPCEGCGEVRVQR
jgi:hypothetical protein